MKRAAMIALAAACLGGCTQDVDPAWQLDHDRVITVRSTPPRIAAGEVAEIDALIGHKGQAPSQVIPDTATVVSPSGLDAQLAHSSSGWSVTVPSDAQLAAARTELGLEPGAPVPLRLRVTFTEAGLVAFKVVWLGEHADNPVIDPIMIDGADGLALSQIAVPVGVKVPLAVELDDTYNINWLTSCGTMHDFDLARAYLRVEAKDPKSGTLAIVVRDPNGGVGWHLWPITAE